MLLPVITLGTGGAAIIARMTRSSMLEVIGQDYIRTARAKGMGERVVIYRHALKNALIPVITVVGLEFGGFLGGAVLTETIFAINGMGRLTIDAIRTTRFPDRSRDCPCHFILVRICKLARRYIVPHIEQADRSELIHV